MSQLQTDKHYMVLTAVGPDRPGLVEQVSRNIHQAGANFETSRMAILGGEFALLVLVSGTTVVLGRFEAGLPELAKASGLKLDFRATGSGAARDALPYRLRVSGFDHPGIVAHLSRVLARHTINVASLESRVYYAPLSGTPMFLLQAELQIPTNLALSQLRQDLTETCNAENLDLNFESMP